LRSSVVKQWFKNPVSILGRKPEKEKSSLPESNFGSPLVSSRAHQPSPFHLPNTLPASERRGAGEQWFYAALSAELVVPKASTKYKFR
jgi:hypothetical protein